MEKEATMVQTSREKEREISKNIHLILDCRKTQRLHTVIGPKTYLSRDSLYINYAEKCIFAEKNSYGLL